MIDIQEKIGNTMTYGGSAGAVLGGISLNEVAAVVGVIAAIIGIVIQLSTASRRRRQETELHEARMEAVHEMEEADDVI